MSRSVQEYQPHALGRPYCLLWLLWNRQCEITSLKGLTGFVLLLPERHELLKHWEYLSSVVTIIQDPDLSLSFFVIFEACLPYSKSAAGVYANWNTSMLRKMITDCQYSFPVLLIHFIWGLFYFLSCRLEMQPGRYRVNGAAFRALCRGVTCWAAPQPAELWGHTALSHDNSFACWASVLTSSALKYKFCFCYKNNRCWYGAENGWFFLMPVTYSNFIRYKI